MHGNHVPLPVAQILGYPMKYRLVWEKDTKNCAAYSELDGFIKGLIYFTKDQLPSGKPPARMILTLEVDDALITKPTARKTSRNG